MDTIRKKWDFLLQCRPNIRSLIGNAKLIGGHIGHNSNHEKILHFITRKGTFTSNEMTLNLKANFRFVKFV